MRSRMLKRSVPEPSIEVIERSFKAVSVIDSSVSDAPGVILDQRGTLLWRFHTEPRRHMWSVRNVRRKPEFVVSDSDGVEMLRIRRAARVPPVFRLEQDARVTGHIRLRSLFRNRYAIALVGQSVWSFRMPLYTVLFHGRCTSGSQAWVRVGSNMRQWQILLDADGDTLPLLSALAFIHRERWCYA